MAPQLHTRFTIRWITHFAVFAIGILLGALLLKWVQLADPNRKALTYELVLFRSEDSRLDFNTKANLMRTVFSSRPVAPIGAANLTVTPAAMVRTLPNVYEASNGVPLFVKTYQITIDGTETSETVTVHTIYGGKSESHTVTAKRGEAFGIRLLDESGPRGTKGRQYLYGLIHIPPRKPPQTIQSNGAANTIAR